MYIPILLYGLEACLLTKSGLSSLEFVLNRFMKNLYSPSKHGRRINNTNINRTTQLQSRQNTLEAI